jgi:hypothetical protein
MNAPSNDTQRELEQRALRNVRGLVDKVESQDLADKRSERRLLKGLAIGAVLLCVLFAVLFSYLGGKQAGKTITIEQKR